MPSLRESSRWRRDRQREGRPGRRRRQGGPWARSQAARLSSGRSSRVSRIEIEIPEGRRQNPVGFIAELESIEVAPDPSGKVVIDSASGVIIFGERVRIGKVAVSYRDVTVNVGAAGAYAPRSGSFGTAASAAFGEQERQHFTFGETTTVEELVETLRAIGLGTEAIIPIIQAIDKAGALFGKLVIM
jgi:flagellar P-ring protein precursor FlgI